MTTQEQTNNKFVKIYKGKRNTLSFLLNNEVLLERMCFTWRKSNYPLSYLDIAFTSLTKH